MDKILNLKDSEECLSNHIKFFKENLEKNEKNNGGTNQRNVDLFLNHLKSIKDNIQIFHEKNIESFYELINLLLKNILNENNEQFFLIIIELIFGITNLNLNYKDTYLFNKINKEDFSKFLEFLLPEYSKKEIEKKKKQMDDGKKVDKDETSEEKKNKKNELILPNLNQTKNGEKIIYLMSAISNNEFIGSYFYKILTFMEKKECKNIIVNKIIKDNSIYNNIYFTSTIFPILKNSLFIFGGNDIMYNNINYNKILAIKIFTNILGFFYGEIDEMIYEKSTDVKNFLIKLLNKERIKEKENFYKINIIDFFSNLISIENENSLIGMKKILSDVLNRKKFYLYETILINILTNILINKENNIIAKNNVIHILFYMFKNKNAKKNLKIICDKFLIEKNIEEIIINLIKSNDNLKIFINFILKLSFFYKEYYFKTDKKSENKIYNFIKNCNEIFEKNKDNEFNEELIEIKQNLK